MLGERRRKYALASSAGPQRAVRSTHSLDRNEDSAPSPSWRPCWNRSALGSPIHIWPIGSLVAFARPMVDSPLLDILNHVESIGASSLHISTQLCFRETVSDAARSFRSGNYVTCAPSRMCRYGSKARAHRANTTADVGFARIVSRRSAIGRLFYEPNAV
jgi:hypothetical protein